MEQARSLLGMACSRSDHRGYLEMLLEVRWKASTVLYCTVLYWCGNVAAGLLCCRADWANHISSLNKLLVACQLGNFSCPMCAPLLYVHICAGRRRPLSAEPCDVPHTRG